MKLFKGSEEPSCAKPVLMLLSTALVFLTGCSQIRNGATLHAGAPRLESNTAQARNAANPNGPLNVVKPAPHLTQRATLLDIDELEPCQPTKLTLSETQAQSSGFSRTLRLSLINTGEACRLGGFPAVSLLGPTGNVLANVQIHKVSATGMAASMALSGNVAGSSQDSSGSAPSPQIMLAANDEAEFQIGWTTGPDCEQVSRIAVAAPGTTRSILIGRPLAVCNGEVLLTAVSLSNTR